MDDAVKEYIHMRDDASSALVRVKQQIIAFCIRHGKVHDSKELLDKQAFGVAFKLEFRQ